MKRRTILAGLGGVAVSAGAGGVVAYVGSNRPSGQHAESEPTDSEPIQTVSDVPTAVESVQPLAEDFHQHISEYFDGVRVFISEDGAIEMTYKTEAGSGDELTSEMNRIAVEFATIVKENDYEPTTLTMVIGDVKRLVPESSLKAYVDGEINEEAFLETLHTLGSPKQTATGSTDG